MIERGVDQARSLLPGGNTAIAPHLPDVPTVPARRVGGRPQLSVVSAHLTQPKADRPGRGHVALRPVIPCLTHDGRKTLLQLREQQITLSLTTLPSTTRMPRAHQISCMPSD